MKNVLGLQKMNIEELTTRENTAIRTIINVTVSVYTLSTVSSKCNR
ncbi:class III lanthipeptide [Staphylococcus felis]